jgi:hypothetical protein
MSRRVIRHAETRLHTKAKHVHTITEAISSLLFAVETSHMLIAFFFVAWACLDIHEVFWGLEYD